MYQLKIKLKYSNSLLTNTIKLSHIRLFLQDHIFTVKTNKNCRCTDIKSRRSESFIPIWEHNFGLRMIKIVTWIKVRIQLLLIRNSYFYSSKITFLLSMYRHKEQKKPFIATSENAFKDLLQFRIKNYQNCHVDKN